MTKPLRVGLLVNSLEQPAWVERVIRDIQQSSIAEIVLIVENVARPAEQNPLRRLVEKRPFLLYTLYERIDRRLFGAAGDPFERRGIAPLVGNCPVLRVRPRMTRHSD